MEWKPISELPKPEDRVLGHYFIKRIGVEDVEVSLYTISWGMFGWWVCGEETASYDDDIELVCGPIIPPELPKE